MLEKKYIIQCDNCNFTFVEYFDTKEGGLKFLKDEGWKFISVNKSKKKMLICISCVEDSYPENDDTRVMGH